MAAIELKISTTDLLQLLDEKGYSIEINQIDDTKFVIYKGKFSADYETPTTYTTEFTDYEIRRDQAKKLMKWAGLFPRISLDWP